MARATINIRPLGPEEQKAFPDLMLEAFGAEEGPHIAGLVSRFLNLPEDQRLLVLVAEDRDGELLGGVVFTRVLVDSQSAENNAAANNQNLRVNILCPLGVVPGRQQQGVGSLLVREGVHRLKQQGEDAMLVLGDPRYYSRFGFHPSHPIAPPYPLPYPEAWMAMALSDIQLSGLKGVARCVTPLADPEFW